MMTEKEILDLLSDYLDDRLDRSTRQAVEAGLARSATARQTLRELADTLHRLEKLPRLAAPNGLQSSIRSAAKRQLMLARAGREMVTTQSRRLLWRRMLPLAAAVAFSCSGALLVWWAQLRFAEHTSRRAVDSVAVGVPSERSIDAGSAFRTDQDTTDSALTHGDWDAANPGSQPTQGVLAGMSLTDMSLTGMSVADMSVADMSTGQDPERVPSAPGSAKLIALARPSDSTAEFDLGGTSKTRQDNSTLSLQGKPESPRIAKMERDAVAATRPEAPSVNKYAEKSAAPPQMAGTASLPRPQLNARARGAESKKSYQLDRLAGTTSLREQVLEILPSVAELAKSVPPSPVPPPEPVGPRRHLAPVASDVSPDVLDDKARVVQPVNPGSVADSTLGRLPAKGTSQIASTGSNLKTSGRPGKQGLIAGPAAPDVASESAFPTEFVLVSTSDVRQLEARLRRDLQPFSDRGMLVWLDTAEFPNPEAEHRKLAEPKTPEPKTPEPKTPEPKTQDRKSVVTPPSVPEQNAAASARFGEPGPAETCVSFTLTTHDPAVVAELFAALRRAASSNSLTGVEWAPSLEACQRLADTANKDEANKDEANKDENVATRQDGHGTRMMRLVDPAAASPAHTKSTPAGKLDAGGVQARPMPPELTDVLSQTVAVERQLKRLQITAAPPQDVEVNNQPATSQPKMRGMPIDKAEQHDADSPRPSDPKTGSPTRVLRIMVSLQPRRP